MRRPSIVVLALVLGTSGCAAGSPPAAPSGPVTGTSISTVAPTSAPTGSGAVTNLSAAAAATPASSAVSPGAATGRPSASGRPSSSASSSAATPGTALVAGNPAGRAAVPTGAGAYDTSRPTRWVGTGTPASCTSDAVVAAVAAGGVIRFRCGPAPVTIVLTRTAKVRSTSPLVVLDGGGLVTLSGGGRRRILYQDTCDRAQVWATDHCANQQTPQLVVQNLTFADGNATGQAEEGGGGGAILVRGGQFRIVHARFVRNRCDAQGPDLGGAAVRVLDQWQQRPVTVVDSTFGGAPGQGGVCSNGGALSSIGVSWTVINSVLSYNQAIGRGANPARAGTAGGGSGGAIYADGNTMTLRLASTLVEHNTAQEGGGAVFFVSNDRSGSLRLEDCVLRSNPSKGFQTQPGIFFLGRGAPVVSGTSLR